MGVIPCIANFISASLFLNNCNNFHIHDTCSNTYHKYRAVNYQVSLLNFPIVSLLICVLVLANPYSISYAPIVSVHASDLYYGVRVTHLLFRIFLIDSLSFSGKSNDFGQSSISFFICCVTAN